MSKKLKEYNYTKHGEVVLSKYDDHFEVYYDPTGVTKRFDTWEEAEAYAKEKQAHIQAVYRGD